MITTRRKQLLLVFAIIGLIGCSPLVSIVQPDKSGVIEISQGKSAGQTFTADYSGLQAITLFLAPGTDGDGKINLVLRENQTGNSIQALDLKSITEVNSPGNYRFKFNPITDSSGTDYYLELNIKGTGSINVGTGDAKSYLDGALYINGQPVDKQMSFRLAYDQFALISGLIKEGFLWLGILMLSTIFFILPGWITMSLVLKNWQSMFWGIKLGLAIGISLSIYPIFFLWTNVVNLQLGSLYAWIPVILAIISWIVIRRSEILHTNFSLRNRLKKITLPDITYAMILIFIFGVRFWVVRTLDIPLWGDSYQHSMITQLLIDHRGLFDSWAPYAELVTFTYHFGFHSFAAVLSWTADLTAPDAVKWTGQVINGFAVISLFPIASIVRRNIWTGIVSTLFAGLIFTMPMFFVNWGRYTQLSGLALLAVFAYFSWSLFENKVTDFTKLILSIIILSALALAHFRVVVFATIFLVILVVFYFRRIGIKSSLKTFFFIGAGSFILFLPWFLNIFSGLLLDILGYQMRVNPTSQSSGVYSLAAEIGSITAYLPQLVWLTLPFLIGWALWRRSTPIAIINTWWITVFVISVPQLFNLPGAGSISAFAVVISLFFPASLIIGEFSGWFIDNFLPGKYGVQNPVSIRGVELNRIIPPLISILLIIIGVWGTAQRKEDLDKDIFSLVTRPDIRASTWITENLPNNSNMLVNSFFAYGGSLIAGSDGGWWLPLLAQRNNSVPPLSYGSEKGDFPGYQQWVNELTANIEKNGINHPGVLSMLKNREYTHVYIGQRQGSVNSPAPLLDINQLINSPHYIPIYHQDLVWIFEIKY